MMDEAREFFFRAFFMLHFMLHRCIIHHNFTGFIRIITVFQTRENGLKPSYSQKVRFQAILQKEHFTGSSPAAGTPWQGHRGSP